MDQNKVVEKAEASQKRHRELTKALRGLFIGFSIMALGGLIYYIFRFSFLGVFQDPGIYYYLLAWFLPLVYLIFPARAKDIERLPYYDMVLAALTFVGYIYLFSCAAEMTLKGWEVGFPAVPVPVLIICLIEWALLLEAVRRTSGLTLTFIILFFSLYPLFANHMPDVLLGLSFDFDSTISRHFLSTASVVGIAFRTYADLVIGFMVFAVCLQVLGGGKFFIDFANALFGHATGGPAKVCVMGSGLMATMSGSVFANILTVGSFTIPTMRKAGYSPIEAGAIETCASTAGVLTPPIMGATAFVMAGLLGVSYGSIIIAAAIPAALYYWSLFWSVDAIAVKKKIFGLPREGLPKLLPTLAGGWPYILAVAVLLWLLLVYRLDKQAPWLAAALLIILALFKKDIRPSFRTVVEIIENSGKQLCELAAILAGIGMIMGGLSITGASHSLSSELLDLAGGSLILIVVLGAVANFILGMGMTITACYIITAVLVAPALIQMGLNVMAVHLFLMYWGMLSYITPPVALGAYVAGTLAGESGFKVGLRACQLGLPLFLLPFFFVFNPALVAQGTGMEILEAVLFAAAGFWLVSSGLEGYIKGMGELGVLGRWLAVMMGLLLAFPERTTSLWGLGMAVIFFAYKFMETRKASKGANTKEV